MSKFQWITASLLFSLSSYGLDTYEGPWKTTNRKLDGTMTAEITKLAEEKWQGHFFGTWNGAKFDYNETFQGKPDALRGTAYIDYANYHWTGKITEDEFKAEFDGDRYKGSFELERKPAPAPKPSKTAENE